jgi:hypothetical protein
MEHSPRLGLGQDWWNPACHYHQLADYPFHGWEDWPRTITTGQSILLLSDVISELRQSGRGYVDDITLLWWRHVNTNGSPCCWENWCDPTKTRFQKHLFDDFKNANVKKNLVQAIMLHLKGKRRPDSVRQPRTLETKNAPVPSYYIDSRYSFLGHVYSACRVVVAAVMPCSHHFRQPNKIIFTSYFFFTEVRAIDVPQAILLILATSSCGF